VLFAAYSHASGGRWGIPKANRADDKARPSVHDEMVREGRMDIDRLRRDFANDPRNLSGDERIVKVIPKVQPSGDNPAEDYPWAPGIPQWILTEKHDFYVALEVDATGIAKTAAGWSVAIGPNAAYDGRARLFQYIAALKVKTR
jgi:hypothetical protein